MKKLFLVCCICFAALFTKAQQTKEQTDFNTYSQSAEKEAHNDYDKKDYTTSVTVSKEWFTRYEALSPAMKKDFQGYRAGFYYNLACYEAMAGQKSGRYWRF